MKIFDVPIAELREIAKDIGVRFEGTDISNSAGYRVQGSLKPTGIFNPYQRTSRSFFHPGRKVSAICWHGYRDFMRLVFQHNPNARITTGLYGKQDYRGQADFEDSYRESGLTKIGPPIADGYPRLCEACTCPDSGRNN